DDARAGGQRLGRGAVNRTVVDHHHVVDEFATGVHDAADRSLRVERRDDHQHTLAHAASLEITAETIPPPAEMELRRMYLRLAARGSRFAAMPSSGSICSKPTERWSF